MSVSKKSFGFVAFAVSLLAMAGTANATLLLSYDSVVTGPAPLTGSSPWLTTTITDETGGVSIAFATSVSGSEFITGIFFSLTGGNPALVGPDPTGNPDFNFGTCNGAAPAGTGPWQLCVGFSSTEANRFSSADGIRTYHLSGVTEEDFNANGSGYFSVAHVQGINNSCSGWIGDNGPSSNGVGDGSCTRSVPEPGTLALLGLGMLGLGLSRRRIKA